MGPPTPPLMGSPGGGGPAAAGLGPFGLVRRSAESPSMGLLRRPTTSKIVEDGRFSRTYGPGVLPRIQRNHLAAAPPFPHFTVPCDVNCRQRTGQPWSSLGGRPGSVGGRGTLLGRVGPVASPPWSQVGRGGGRFVLVDLLDQQHLDGGGGRGRARPAPCCSLVCPTNPWPAPRIGIATTPPPPPRMAPPIRVASSTA